jgi:fructosamine-3-kinase
LIFRANSGINPEPEVVMEVEKLITDRIAKEGIPTNRVLSVDVSRDKYAFDFQIQEMLEGKDLEDYFTGTREEYDELSFQIGQIIAKLSKITFPKFGRFDLDEAKMRRLQGLNSSFYEYMTLCLESDLEYLVEAKVLSSSQSKQIVKLFEDHKDIINIDQGCLVHYDLADHNITFNNNKITSFFDWETAVVGDSVLDLASCPTWRLHYPREEKMMEGYKSFCSLPDNFQEKYNIYKLRTILWKTVYCIRANILTPARAERMTDTLKPYKI